MPRSFCQRRMAWLVSSVPLSAEKTGTHTIYSVSTQGRLQSFGLAHGNPNFGVTNWCVPPFFLAGWHEGAGLAINPLPGVRRIRFLSSRVSTAKRRCAPLTSRTGYGPLAVMGFRGGFARGAEDCG